MIVSKDGAAVTALWSLWGLNLTSLCQIFTIFTPGKGIFSNGSLSNRGTEMVSASTLQGLLGSPTVLITQNGNKLKTFVLTYWWGYFLMCNGHLMLFGHMTGCVEFDSGPGSDKEPREVHLFLGGLLYHEFLHCFVKWINGFHQIYLWSVIFTHG